MGPSSLGKELFIQLNVKPYYITQTSTSFIGELLLLLLLLLFFF